MAGWMVPGRATPPRFPAAFDAAETRASADFPDRRTHKRGGELFREGDRVTHLVHVQEGLVKLVKHSREGKDVIVEICGPGAVMGETSLLDGHPYDATAVVMTPAVTLWESLTSLHSRISRTPAVLHDLVRSLSTRLRESQTMLQGLAVDRVDARLATLLVKLTERPAGSAVPSPEIPLTRQEMAEAVGATTETTIRVVGKFIRDGAVQGRNRKLVVTDLRYLKNLANGSAREGENLRVQV